MTAKPHLMRRGPKEAKDGQDEMGLQPVTEAGDGDCCFPRWIVALSFTMSSPLNSVSEAAAGSASEE